jgi:hypothetical protein
VKNNTKRDMDEIVKPANMALYACKTPSVIPSVGVQKSVCRLKVDGFGV